MTGRSYAEIGIATTPDRSFTFKKVLTRALTDDGSRHELGDAISSFGFDRAELAAELAADLAAGRG